PKELNSGLQSLKSSISRGFFKNYTYGKQNSLFTLRASQGQTIYLSDKMSKKNVLVGYTYRYGISAGVIKHYYIQVVKEDEGFSAGSLSISNIPTKHGRPSWTTKTFLGKLPSERDSVN